MWACVYRAECCRDRLPRRGGETKIHPCSSCCPRAGSQRVHQIVPSGPASKGRCFYIHEVGRSAVDYTTVRTPRLLPTLFFHLSKKGCVSKEKQKKTRIPMRGNFNGNGDGWWGDRCCCISHVSRVCSVRVFVSTTWNLPRHQHGCRSAADARLQLNARRVGADSG